STYDFPSDENRNKVVARQMLNLLGDVGAALREIEPSGPERVNMWCHTCHAGKPRPMTLEETLTEVRTLEGQEAAASRYVALREEFYGGNQYDFRPATVESAALGFLEAGDTLLAAGLLEANVGNHPDRADGYERLGDLARARGDLEGAIRWYEATLERDPEHPRAAEKLAEIRGS
ncbi:MAG TPA: tetratricopeptide repeat protein, partial [Longimicrobiales bacterium]|nr:tetratricopeptide repeat protein [Longimicrobiales bacterium]